MDSDFLPFHPHAITMHTHHIIAVLVLN